MPSSYPLPPNLLIILYNDIRVKEYRHKKNLPTSVAGQLQQLDERSQPLLTQML